MAIVSTEKIPGNWDTKGDFVSRHQRQLRLLMNTSQTAFLEEKIRDLVYAHPTEDGNAYYVVVKETPFTIAHIPYLGSRPMSETKTKALVAKDALDHNSLIHGLRSEVAAKPKSKRARAAA